MKKIPKNNIHPPKFDGMSCKNKAFKDIKSNDFKSFMKAMAEIHYYIYNLSNCFHNLWHLIRSSQGEVPDNKRITVKELSLIDKSDDIYPNLTYSRSLFESYLIATNNVINKNLINSYDKWKNLENHIVLKDEQIKHEKIAAFILDRAKNSRFENIITLIDKINQLYGYDPITKAFERKGIEEKERALILKDEFETIISKESKGYDLISNNLNLHLGDFKLYEYPTEIEVEETLYKANGFKKASDNF